MANDSIEKLIARMVITTMVNDKEKTWQLYKKYLNETRLFVAVWEILKAKKEKSA